MTTLDGVMTSVPSVDVQRRKIKGLVLRDPEGGPDIEEGLILQTRGGSLFRILGFFQGRYLMAYLECLSNPDASHHMTLTSNIGTGREFSAKE